MIFDPSYETYEASIIIAGGVPVRYDFHFFEFYVGSATHMY